MKKSLSNSGVYCLTLKLEKPTRIKIGALGVIKFDKGFYYYVGSALNSLDKRILRHKSKDKKIHWHIDYLTKKAKIIDVKTIKTNKKLECLLAKKVKHKADSEITNFGSSDCKCKSHLYYSSKKVEV